MFFWDTVYITSSLSFQRSSSPMIEQVDQKRSVGLYEPRYDMIW